MIEKYYIDPSLGYPDRRHPNECQVGLFIRADENMAKHFQRLLRRNGFQCVPIDRMPPKDPKYTHFTYVSTPDSKLDKQGIHKLLKSLCERVYTGPARQVQKSPQYEDWKTAFEKYVREYRDQRYASEVEENFQETFDKDRAYELIHSGQYEEAERYLQSFATDAPPFLVPAYFIYLYHRWQRPDFVIRTHERYISQINSGDVDHRVIEWIVQAYLNVSPPRPEHALAVLDDFLPEFQRQRVSDSLLALRARARAMQGQLPQNLPELRDYVTRLPVEELDNRLEDLLEVISGVSNPGSDIQELLDAIASRLPSSRRWRIELERSALARRANRLADALEHVQNVIDESPSDLSSADLDELRLNASALHLSLEQPQAAAELLQDVVPEDLSTSEQRVYSSLRGRALAKVGDDRALEILYQAYEVGARRAEVLRPLARLAYRAGDSRLAWRVYSDLLQTRFEPSLEDRLYTGILAYYEEDEPIQAVEYLRPTLEEVPVDAFSADTMLMAYETLVGCLMGIEAKPDEIVDAVGSWIDVLVAESDTEGLVRLVERIPEMGLGRSQAFSLLEAIESVLYDDPEGRARLIEAYIRLFWREVDIALRNRQPLPEYTLPLRRALFTLDREQFDFAQSYLEDELQRARAADLVEHDFTPEPSESERLDLSGYHVALIGGYAPMRRRVQEILIKEHGLDRFTEVPPSWEEHVDKGRVAEAVRGADLIVVVHRCIKHDGTDALHAVVDGTALEDRVRYASGKGQSSVVRAVRRHFGCSGPRRSGVH